MPYTTACLLKKPLDCVLTRRSTEYGVRRRKASTEQGTLGAYQFCDQTLSLNAFILASEPT